MKWDETPFQTFLRLKRFKESLQGSVVRVEDDKDETQGIGGY